jgi:hypothetical protein
LILREAIERASVIAANLIKKKLGLRRLFSTNRQMLVQNSNQQMPKKEKRNDVC